MALSACGPPVEAPITSTRGGVAGIGRNTIGWPGEARSLADGAADVPPAGVRTLNWPAAGALRAGRAGGFSRSGRGGSWASR